jgi:hydrogenase-4 component F
MIVSAHPDAIDRPHRDRHGFDFADFAAFMLYQRRDIKRLFAYSSIEHMGLIANFGMGGPPMARAPAWRCTT